MAGLLADVPAAPLAELSWTIAMARLIFGPDMSIQAPPNLNDGKLGPLIDAGINDWGGVSALTPDYVNPEAPWPHLDALANDTAQAGKFLEQRLTVYPAYAQQASTWIDPAVQPVLARQADSEGFARRDSWLSGSHRPMPTLDHELITEHRINHAPDARMTVIIEACKQGQAPSIADVTHLFSARGNDFTYVCQQADALTSYAAGVFRWWSPACCS